MHGSQHYYPGELTKRFSYRNHAIQNQVDLLKPRNLPSQRFGCLTLRATVSLLLRKPGPI